LIRRLRQHVGFVFQNFNLFPHRTVLENIIEGPVIVKGEPKEEATRGRANCSPKSGWQERDQLSASPVGRAAAARGDSARAGDAP
jgi:ABC-type polar amino acid transport system ATPase subunit